MSSPLSSLKKPHKNPILLGSRSVPFRSPAYTEDEGKLLDEITTNMASSRLKASHTRDPFAGGLPKLDVNRSQMMYNSPSPRVNNPSVERSFSSSSFHDDIDSSTFITAPNDHELMSSMMARISILEQKVQSQTKEIGEKDKKIRILEDKVKIMQKAQGHVSPTQSHELEKKCLLLQQQIHEMEAFLADYGMVWVGEKTDPNSAYYNDNSSASSDSEEEVWRPETSLSSYTQTNNAFVTEPSPQKKKVTFAIDYDKVIENIRDLNVLAGEGISKIQHTTDGARLKLPDPIPFVLYANGMMLFSGPFRPFSDPQTQECVQDIMDGYFPSELQTKYPDGIPFVVTDLRDTYFEDKRRGIFKGPGQVLGGETKPSRLVPESKTSSKFKSQTVPANTPENMHPKITSDIPGVKMTVGQFLQKLPKSVIKDGKVIDIRKSVGENLQDSKMNPAVTVVDTDTVKDLKKRLDMSEESRPITPRDITTLRVKSEAGNHTYIFKMKFNETIGDLRKYIDLHRSPGSQPYNIVSAYPSKIFDDDQASLVDSGLTPNAVLHLRIKRS